MSSRSTRATHKFATALVRVTPLTPRVPPARSSQANARPRRRTPPERWKPSAIFTWSETLRSRRAARRACSCAMFCSPHRTVSEPGLTAKTLEGKATQARALRADLGRIHEPEQAVKHALRELGRPICELTTEINELDKHLTQLVFAVAANTLALPQVGPVSVAQLLITAGENFERFRNEAASARLCGVAPIPVSSGKSHRMRLHRGGNRQANRVI